MKTTIDKNQKIAIADRYKDIEGWGFDANPENDPTYPMKNYTGADHERLSYQKPLQQAHTVEILQSNERPEITRVFGTSSPPAGLSGKLRRYAFKYSEGHGLHWLTLLLADRVNEIEGVVDDIRQGHFPNIFKERGWNAEWKYNRKGVIKNISIGLAITTAVAALLIYRNKKNLKSMKG
jgi:hypothetical protein